MVRSCGCPDFSRSELIHRAVEAGRGLPGIEPGMPLPAGTGLTRRNFVTQSLGLAVAVYGGGQLLGEALDDGIAMAADAPPGRVLVSVFLDGGADSLSILFPAHDGAYYKARPRLGILPTGNVFGEDSRLQWHPSAAPLSTLHKEGKLTVMPAVGYGDGNQSHFTSRHFYEVGSTRIDVRTGWLGRYLDRVGTEDNPLQGLSLEGRLQPALATRKVPVASIDGPDRYNLPAMGVSNALEPKMIEALTALGAPHAKSTDPALRMVGDVILQARRLHGRLVPFSSAAIGSPVAYPTSEREQFPRRLAGLAAMLAAGLPIRCVALRAPGMYDTHADQAQVFSDGLKLTSETLLAFQRDLEARGLADRVLVHVWSEFGRRVQENASLGTDHGAAGIGFLLGTRASGRMVGEFPGVRSLDARGNLRPTSDFRGLYAALVEQWLNDDPAVIVPEARGLPRPRVVK